jgi:translation initiation factor 1
MLLVLVCEKCVAYDLPLLVDLPYTRLSIADAFEDAGDKGGVAAGDKVHVRVQQRNGRKCITTIEGLADDLDVKRICKAFKKNFSCNGAVQKDEEAGEVIQLSGDQRTNVKSFLVDQEICSAADIVLHGF